MSRIWEMKEHKCMKRPAKNRAVARLQNKMRQVFWGPASPPSVLPKI